MSAGATALWKADQTESFSIGNCGEQAPVAFKYLLHHTDAKEVSILNVGDNHALLVIGASRSELESARSRRGTFRLDEPPDCRARRYFAILGTRTRFPLPNGPVR